MGGKKRKEREIFLDRWPGRVLRDKYSIFFFFFLCTFQFSFSHLWICDNVLERGPTILSLVANIRTAAYPVSGTSYVRTYPASRVWGNQNGMGLRYYERRRKYKEREREIQQRRVRPFVRPSVDGRSRRENCKQGEDSLSMQLSCCQIVFVGHVVSNL